MPATNSAPPHRENGLRGLLSDHKVFVGLLIACLVVILIGGAIRTIAEGGALVAQVLVPTMLSVLFAALLMPLQVLLNHRLRVPRMLAAALTLLTAIGAVGGLMWLAGAQLAQGMDDITTVFTGQLEELRRWVLGNLPIGSEELNEAITQMQGWIMDNQSSIAQGALGVGFGAFGFFVSTILALVPALFFLAQGDRIAAALVVLLPRGWQRRAWEASRRGWVTLTTYCRTQLVVAAVDAVGIGLGAVVLGLPFVLPVVAITFVLCFIPFVGAIVSGALVVAIALAFEGPTTALIMLAICIAVQQLESNVLSPFLMGKAVDVHPLVILLSVAAGTYVFGFVGALFMVPVIATVRSMAVYVNGVDPFPVLGNGGSALTDPPKKLMGERSDIKNPRRLGDATPAWLADEIEAEAEAVAEAHGDTSA